MSGGGTPYIGSKISLISKAKIRYEGYLYTIDTEESTVTLAKVKSFGTENRKVTSKVPERNEIYEYIVFRGSDIDDLHVAAAPNDNKQGQVAEDPAIVQTGNAQPNMYQQQMPVQLGTPFPPQSYGPFGAMPYGYPMGFRPQGNMPLSSVIGHGGMSDRNTRSSPFDRYRKSPSPPSAGPIGSRYQSKKEEEITQPIEPDSNMTRQRENQRSYEGQPSAQKLSKEPKGNHQPPKESEGSKERVHSERPSARKHSKDIEQQRERRKDVSENKEQVRIKDQQEGSRSSKKQTEGRDVNAKEKFESKERDRKKQSYEVQRRKDVPSDSARNLAKENSKETGKDENSSHPPSNSDNAKGHSRGRGRNRGRGRGGHSKTKQFDKDFDFERANAKFNKEEIEKELLSLKKHVTLKDEDDVIVEDGNKVSDHDEVEAELNGEDVYYDKSKSFFDQISCDSVGQSGDILSRRKERALNAETFGVSTRNFRGRPYRGRGGRGSRGRGYGRGGQNARRGGRGGNRTWVDYEFDFEAAGIRQGGKSYRSAAS